VGFGPMRDLIAHAGAELKATAIAELRIRGEAARDDRRPTPGHSPAATRTVSGERSMPSEVDSSLRGDTPRRGPRGRPSPEKRDLEVVWRRCRQARMSAPLSLVRISNGSG
jgi:hypothetical protein